MNSQKFEDYLKDRYQVQMKYYKSATKKNQKVYLLFQWILIVFAALTPICATLGEIKSSAWIFEHLNIVVIILSTVVAILTTGLKTFNYIGKWTIYRSTYENLKQEIHLFNFVIGPYKVEVDRESLFVERVESILNVEHKKWSIREMLLPENDVKNRIDML